MSPFGIVLGQALDWFETWFGLCLPAVKAACRRIIAQQQVVIALVERMFIFDILG
jgi:hypothetical protein